MARIISIGSGNVASHLIPHLHSKGHDIVQVLSLDIAKARRLARKVKAKAINQLKQLDQSADIYLLMVPDDRIEEIAALLPFRPNKKQIVCHSSGSVSSQVLKLFPNYGVFYPLQTFSKGVKLDYKEIPFFITGNSRNGVSTLSRLAKDFSKYVKVTTDADRKTIHLSAVVASNFVNHLLAASASILDDITIDFDILKPLIKETIQKAFKNHPSNVQTGPAIRNDTKVMREHLKMLNNDKGLKQIYRLISKEIKNTHENSR